GLDEAAWRAEVRSALGRSIPATEIPWLRVREVWLHAVDLAAGVQVEDLHPGLVDALLDDVTATLCRRPDRPPVRLVATDRDRTWLDGPTDLTAPAARLLAWATGREAAPVPLPRWL
ncbi:MAG TPA: hypothetical protein VJT31_18475, partial [Rugosimonospora sp.]|nr:hypothetical protein [Rugosimonospora sp.]